MNIIRALKARAQRKQIAAKNKERAAFCDLLNAEYGGDWYYEQKDDLYHDAMTTRTIKDCGEVGGVQV